MSDHDNKQCADDLRDAYEDGVQDSMLRATRYERILTDLIQLMRDCAALNAGAPLSRAMDRVLDNTEARLREANDTPTQPLDTHTQ